MVLGMTLIYIDPKSHEQETSGIIQQKCLLKQGNGQELGLLT